MKLSREAEALKHNMETGDRTAWAALLAPDCTNWHNNDHRTINSKSMGSRPPDTFESMTCEIVQCEVFPGGQLFRIQRTGKVRATGKIYDAHSCMVIETSDEGIRRIYHYVDTEALGAFKADGDDR